MKPVCLTAAQMRAVEQAAANGGLNYLRLMENAGSAAARLIRTRYAVSGKKAVVLCGRGNNGGDGFVIARKLYEEGAAVSVVLTDGQPGTPEAFEMLGRIPTDVIPRIVLSADPSRASAAVREAALLVDAVYGIGFHGALPDRLRPLFREINRAGLPIAAVDVPSGLSADTGEFDPDTPRAALTVTFTAAKPGLTCPGAAGVCGEVQVAAIGIDEALLAPYAASPITPEMVSACFPSRRPDSHKGDYGHALLLCGSRGMVGAAVMAAKAALRCGAGLVELALPASLYPLAAAHLCEPIFTLLEETSDGDFSPANRARLEQRLRTAQALAVGCGLGTSPGAESLVLYCLEHADCPIVLDADGINILSRHINTVKAIRSPLILTPHPGEMARFIGQPIAAVEADRTGAACRLAEDTDAIVVLKGRHTVVAAPGRAPRVNPTGNPGMATGGSGDVLTGMIASFLAQGMEPLNAALCGVYLHGAAGDRAAARLSQHAMLPTDLTDELGGLFLNLEK